MKRRKGQVIIVATLVIAILILSVAAMLYQTLTIYQSVRREYINGLIDNISHEFDKVLTYTLVGATHRYNLTAELDTPRADAYLKFSYWVKSVIRELSEYGVQINVSLPRTLLQNSKTIFNQSLEDRYVYDLLKMYWYSPQGLSVISASYTINMPGIGFYGWNKTSLILLNATVLVDSIRDERIGSETYTAVDVLVNKENGLPVERLTSSSFKVLYFEPDTERWSVARISDLFNNGGGNYTLYLSRVSGGSLPSGLQKDIVMWVVDDRGIMVELYTYDHIDYIVKENAIQQFYPDANKSYQIYTFEVIQNGSWFWLNKQLSSNGYKPIPVPPVKQLRVNSTHYGVNDVLTEVPSQVEVWTSDYQKPTLHFADWKRRFGLGDKLVFLVWFNETGIDEQKVRIYWLHDADVSPPRYLIHFSVEPPYAYINNSVYVLQLVANPGYSDWIDWSISLHGKGYHIEYSLYGYDVYRFGGGYWFPKKLPGGNWTILAGPIRAVAFRESNITVIPPLESEVDDEIHHIELIEVPYGVSYFLYFGYFRWLKNVKLDYRYLTLFGQISGTSNDTDSPLRMKYGSLQLEDEDSYVTGNYTIYNPSNPARSNSMHRDRNYNDAGNFGYWATQYNSHSGQIIFTNEETYNLMKSHTYRGYSQVWAWSTYDYARRVMSYDLMYWSRYAGSYTISSGTEMNIFFAGFLYNGGEASSPYKDIDVWNDRDVYGSHIPYIYAFHSSTGADVPQVYYRMFLESYVPSIEVIGA